MKLRNLIENSWRRPNLLTWGLWPLSRVYRLLYLLRSGLYNLGLLRRYRAPRPVIIVGNLTVGGTGKTPLIIYLVNLLRARGFTPGVISRGYGGQAQHYPLVVNAGTSVAECGDEPALIVRRTGVPMVVGPDRKASIETLMRQFDVNVILSDDGLQHLALQRDIEVCLLDATSPLKNTCQLPAGPFREPLSRLDTVDLIVRHGATSDVEYARHVEFAMTLTPSRPLPVCDPQGTLNRDTRNRDTRPPSFNPEKALHAVAGIGNPDRFFATCKQLGYQFQAHPLPDHHEFLLSDIDFGSDTVLMTEKDAVKCRDFADQRHWYLPVDAKLSAGFDDALVTKLQTLL